MKNIELTEETLNNEIAEAIAADAMADALEPRDQAAYYDFNSKRSPLPRKPQLARNTR